MALQAAITDGQSRATSLQKMNRLVEYGLGIGQSAGVVDYGDLRTKLNTLATALGVTNFADRELGSSIRAKLNAMNTALGLDRDLDLYYEAPLSRYWGDTGPVAPSSKIGDTHNDTRAMIQNAAGAWSSLAANALSANDQGLWSYPSRTNSVPNSGMAGGGAGALPTGWGLTGTGMTFTVLGVGVVNGVDYVDIRLAGTPSSAFTIVSMSSIGGQAVAQNQTWAGSVFAALISGSFANVTTGALAMEIRDASSAFLTNGNFVTALHTAIDGTFKRLTGTHLVANATATNAKFQMSFTLTVGQPVDFTLRIGLPQWELGGFASPPIRTTGTTLTRAGNQTVIGSLGSFLTSGVAGFIKMNILEPGSNFVRLFDINDASSNNRVSILFDTGNVKLQVFSGAVLQADINLGAWVTGVRTVAFSVGPNFALGRIVGQSLPSADTVVTYPAMTVAAVGSVGYHTTSNVYQIAQKLGLKFGAQDQASFDAMYALAAAA